MEEEEIIRRAPEIFHLPIIVTERCLEIEKEYIEHYNEDYWKDYNKKRLKILTTK